VTHHSLAFELSQRIFRPLHLTHTALAAGPTPGGSYAHGYSKYFGTMQDVSVFSPTILWAAGGIASTPTDVAAFFRALDAGRIVPLALVREMQAPVAVLPGPPGHREAYGLGLFRATFGCGTVWGHTGDFPGYSTKAFGSRDGSRIAVVIADVDDEKTQTPAEGKAIGELMTAAYCGG
jgi:D-alanyl-D-alanine carboxypeptidase